MKARQKLYLTADYMDWFFFGLSGRFGPGGSGTGGSEAEGVRTRGLSGLQTHGLATHTQLSCYHETDMF